LPGVLGGHRGHDPIAAAEPEVTVFHREKALVMAGIVAPLSRWGRVR
jgi:hypothetical protein